MASTTALLKLVTADPLSLTNPTRLLSLLAKDTSPRNILSIGLQVMIIGAILTKLKNTLTSIGPTLRRYLFPTAYISVTDTAYLWIMAWIAQDAHAQSQIHDFVLSTEESRKVSNGSSNALRSKQNASWKEKEIIGQVLPTYYRTILIKHNGQYLWVTRRFASFARSNNRSMVEEHVEIKTIIFQRNAIRNFLVSAHAVYHAKQDHELLIFHPKLVGSSTINWGEPITRRARPWSSVILPNNMKEEFLQDVENFMSEEEKDWYAARGVPHRRGYLFHGAPGAGKTTLATAIASKLNLNVYIINPSLKGMDDSKLNNLFRSCPVKSLILIEDIDCIFPTGRGRPASDDEEEAVTTKNSKLKDSKDSLIPTVSLSGLLNAIDGVSSQEGCILIASTNHPERLDPALKRAGRFDVQIAFTNATIPQTHALFLHFFPLEDFTVHQKINKKRINADINSREDLEDLARRFTEIVFPEGDIARVGGKKGLGVSMAALQSYLLKYKDEPRVAVDDVGEWVKELIPKIRKSKKIKVVEGLDVKVEGKPIVIATSVDDRVEAKEKEGKEQTDPAGIDKPLEGKAESDLTKVEVKPVEAGNPVDTMNPAVKLHAVEEIEVIRAKDSQ